MPVCALLKTLGMTSISGCSVSTLKYQRPGASRCTSTSQPPYLLLHPKLAWPALLHSLPPAPFIPCGICPPCTAPCRRMKAGPGSLVLGQPSPQQGGHTRAKSTLFDPSGCSVHARQETSAGAWFMFTPHRILCFWTNGPANAPGPVKSPPSIACALHNLLAYSHWLTPAHN